MRKIKSVTIGFDNGEQIHEEEGHESGTGKIKTVTIGFDNGTRIGYGNWPEAASSLFKVGDLVRCRGGRGIPSNLERRIGVIRFINDFQVGVEWAEFMDGHDLNGLAHRHKAGWTLRGADLEHA